jgi:hypothetical protein
MNSSASGLGPAFPIIAASAVAPEPPQAPAVQPAQPTAARSWQFESISDVGASAIAGTSDRDLWFASIDTVYRYDGAATQQVDTGICHPSANPTKQMSATAMYVDEKAIWLYGGVPTPWEGDSGGIRALATRSRRGGKWRCRTQGPSFSILTVAACGTSFWQLSYLYQGILRFGDKPIPGPPVPGSSNTAFWRSCAGPMWVAVNLESNEATPEVWEWSGRTWRSLGPPPDVVKALYGVERGVVWAVGMKNWSNGKLYGEADTVLRYEQGQWNRLQAPAGFSAQSIVGIHAELVWFFGKQQATRWTPAGFDMRALPFDYVTATWVSPTGTLWIGGTAGVGRIRE